MADLPVPGSQLTDEASLAASIPGPVHEIMGLLWSAGHAVYVVGGSLRDALLGRAALDWDLATDARYRDHLQDPDPVEDQAVAARAVACFSYRRT